MHDMVKARRMGIVFIIFIACVLFAVSAPSGLAAEEKDHVIAVAETVGVEISENSRRLVQDIIITELGRVEYLSTVERGRLETVFQEQELQLSGITDTENAAAIGEIVNATLIVVTVVNQAGLGYDLSARVVDVETGEIVTTERTPIASQSDLPNGAQHVAQRLTNRISRTLEIDEHVLTDGAGGAGGSNAGEGSPTDPYYEEAAELLSNYRWEEGEFGRVRDLSYGLSATYRENLYEEFEKRNAPVVMATNIVPLGIGSMVFDRNFLPVTFQGMGALFALGGAAGGEAAYLITGGISFAVGYILGFTEPFRDQSAYNDRLTRALHLE